mgnify:CR=1 FL=1
MHYVHAQIASWSVKHIVGPGQRITKRALRNALADPARRVKIEFSDTLTCRTFSLTEVTRQFGDVGIQVRLPGGPAIIESHASGEVKVR